MAGEEDPEAMLRRHTAKWFRGWEIYYELEPFGFYLIEKLAGADVGFAYSSGDDCR